MPLQARVKFEQLSEAPVIERISCPVMVSQICGVPVDWPIIAYLPLGVMVTHVTLASSYSAAEFGECQ